MKKHILLLFAVCFFAFSCKKDHHPGTDPDPKTYNVNFKLFDFSQSIASVGGGKQVNGIKTNAAPVPVTADYFKIIQYQVYIVTNGNFTLFRSLTVDSAASNFGTISDHLPAGTYFVGIAAGMAGLQIDGDSFSRGVYYKVSSPGNFTSWKDTFFNKFQLTVSGDINQNVTLSRIVGQLEINIEDAIPANAKTIAVTINDEYSSYSFDSNNEQPGGGQPLTFTTLIPDAAKGKPNFKVSSLIANTVAPFKVKITCYDASQKSIGPGATVLNVTCQKNTRTILSGKLFDSGSFDTFTIDINNELDPTPIVIHY